MNGFADGRIGLWLLHLAVPVVASIAGALGLTAIHMGQADPAALAALACGSWVAYAGDRWRDRRSDWSLALRSGVLVSVVGAATALAVLLPQLPSRWPLVLGLGGLVACYPLLERLPLAKTLAVALAWWVAQAGLAAPQGVTAAAALLHPAAAVLALLVLAAVLLCDVKDIDRDRSRGIRNPAELLGAVGLRGWAAGCSGVGMLVAGWSGWWWLSLTGAMLVCLASRGELLRRPLWAPILIDAQLLWPAGAWLLG